MKNKIISALIIAVFCVSAISMLNLVKAYNYQSATSGSCSGNMNSGGSYADTASKDGTAWWIEASTSASLTMTLNFNQFTYAGNRYYSIQFVVKALTAITNDYNGNDWIIVYDRLNVEVYENNYVNYNNGLQSFTTTSTNGIGKIVLGVADNNANDQYLELDCDYVAVAQYSAPNTPSAPTFVFNSNNVGLSWTVSNDNGATISSYTVYRSTDNIHFSSIGTPTTNSYQDAFSGLNIGQTYYYSITATNAGGTSAYSASSTVFYTVPTAPLSLTAQYSTSNEVLLQWNAPTNNGYPAVTAYNVYEGTSGSGSEGTGSNWIAQFTGTQSQPAISVVSGRNYYFEVCAVNIIGIGAVSNEVNYDTPTSPPSQPINVEANYTYGNVDLSWSQPQTNGGYGISVYNIFRSTISGGEGNTPLYTGIVNTYYNDSAVVLGNKYYYEITAINNAGEGPKSTEQSILVEPPSTPTTPQNVTAYYSNNGIITLNWDFVVANPSTQSYWIYRSVLSGQESYYNIAYSNTYNDLGVSQGTTYYYKVSAVNTLGNGTKSLEVSALVQETNIPSSPPRDLTAVYSSSTGVTTLTWNTPYTIGASSIVTYEILRSDTSGQETQYVVFDNNDSNTYTDYGVSSTTVYYYTIEALNSAGYWSNPSVEIYTNEFSNPIQYTGSLYNVILNPLVAVGGNVTLNWNAYPNDTTYTIYCYNSTITSINNTIYKVGTVDYNHLTTEIDNTPNGKWYFVIVATTPDGTVISNCQNITIGSTGSNGSNGSTGISLVSSPSFIYLVIIGCALIVVVVVFSKHSNQHAETKSEKIVRSNK